MDLNIFKYTPFQQKAPADKQVLTPEDDLADISNRLLNNDGSFNVVRKGHQDKSAYQKLMTISWLKFLLLVFGYFMVCNVAFATLFTLIGVENIGAAPAGFMDDFMEAFYFSVQTFTTLGYGRLSPIGHMANLVAAVDAFTGMITVALLTGLFFARFSKPRAYIAFSNNILIAPDRDGNKSLQFRIVHSVKDKIIDLEARVTMTWLEKDGERVRRMFAKLPLQIERIFLFPLNWTIVHTIDENSPLYNLKRIDILSRNVEVLVVVKGYDESYSTIVHADRSYQSSDLVEGAEFTGMYQIRKDDTLLDLTKLDDHIPYDFGD